MKRLLLLAVLCLPLAAQTAINDTLYLQGATPWTGQITVSWPAFTSCAGVPIARGSRTVAVNAGVVAISLWPSDCAAPSFAYSATYRTMGGANHGQTWAETWVVPSSPSIVTLATVRKTSTLTAQPLAHASTHASGGSDPLTLTKAQVGLPNVDNTSDASKPVSAAQQAALDLKANTANPTFTGNVSMSGTFPGPVLSVNGFPTGLSNRGNVFIPSDFPALGVDFYRDAAGAYTNSFDPDAYATSWSITKTIYVNPATGNDTTGTGLVGAPYATGHKAIVAAIAAADTAIQITIVTGGANLVLDSNFFAQADTFAISGKRIYITTDDATKVAYCTSSLAAGAYTWTLSAGKASTYEATSYATQNVIDVGNLDAYKIPIAYTKQASIAAVEANAGSWYWSGNVVYVHTRTGAAPVKGTHVANQGVTLFQATLANSAELFLRNIYAVGTPAGNAGAINVVSATGDYTNTKFVGYNIAAAYSDPAFLTSNGVGIQVDGIKSAQIYNSVTAYNSSDGFTAHVSQAYTNQPTTTRQYYVAWINSTSYTNGIGGSRGTANAYTAHEGMNALCVACAGYNTEGPVLAFVNGVYSVVIGSNMRDSVHYVPTSPAHAAYYFDNVLPPSGSTAKVYIDDSTGSDSKLDLSTDGSAMPIYLRNFAGSKIPASVYRNAVHLPSDATTATTQRQAGIFSGSTDPGCTQTGQIGRQWYDTTTTTTAFKVCLSNAGTMGWAAK